MSDFLSGSLPISFAEYEFTLGEAAQFAGVPEKTLRNWIDRNVIKVGKQSILGRRMFCLLDIIRISICNDLVQQVRVEPSAAATIAVSPAIEEIVKQMAARDEDGTLIDLKKGYRPNVNLLVYFENGAPVGYSADIKAAGAIYPPKYDVKGPLSKYRKPYITVPVYSIVHDLILAISEIAEARLQNEGSE